jgi:hypothetical protein
VLNDSSRSLVDMYVNTNNRKNDVFAAGVVSCLTVSSFSISLLLPVAWLVQWKAINAVIS